MNTFGISVIALGLALAATSYGQQRQPDLEAQRAAMKKLGFLAGTWSGDATVIRGPSETAKVRQTEEIQYKQNGLLLLIEGTGRNPDTGNVAFNALAIVSYDDVAGAYRFHAYNDGRYLDTELKVSDNGFEWGYKVGPAEVRFLMKLNKQGEWVETGEVMMGQGPPRKTFEMTVRRQSP